MKDRKAVMIAASDFFKAGYLVRQDTLKYKVGRGENTNAALCKLLLLGGVRE